MSGDMSRPARRVARIGNDEHTNEIDMGRNH